MNTTHTINNTNGNLALKERECMSVPFIVSTTPTPVHKEIDLTFVQFAQRKHAATSYINHLSRIREMKAIHKANRKAKLKKDIKEFFGCVIFTIIMSCMFFGVSLIGLMF